MHALDQAVVFSDSYRGRIDRRLPRQGIRWSRLCLSDTQIPYCCRFENREKTSTGRVVLNDRAEALSADADIPGNGECIGEEINALGDEKLTTTLAVQPREGTSEGRRVVVGIVGDGAGAAPILAEHGMWGQRSDIQGPGLGGSADQQNTYQY